ncbi:MAG: cytidylate kinase family protein [Thermoplasmata archaeon]|nr:cytidylate kinase family protein [Thermoplasmata archaeon]
MVVITISGLPGSGTTTVSKILAKQLKLRYVDAGKIFRRLADDYNMDLAQFGRYAAEHPKIDQELDKKQLEIAREGEVIMEGRLAGWFLHQAEISAFKIWLDAPLETRVERVRRREKKPREIIEQEVQEREKGEIARYKTTYNFNLLDLVIYDLVINTIDLKPAQICENIISQLKME